MKLVRGPRQSSKEIVAQEREEEDLGQTAAQGLNNFIDNRESVVKELQEKVRIGEGLLEALERDHRGVNVLRLQNENIDTSAMVSVTKERTLTATITSTRVYFWENEEVSTKVELELDSDGEEKLRVLRMEARNLLQITLSYARIGIDA